MLHKKYFLTLILVFGLMISGMFKISIAKDVDTPAEVTIENTYQNPKKYEPCKFSHKKHAEEYTLDEKGEKKIACDSCHHVYENGKNTWEKGQAVKKCNTDSCHPGNQNLSHAQAKKLSQEEKVKEISWAYHENCIMCHKAVKNVKPNAWTSCAKCHTKKK
ncbi:MAG: cytochrome c3 family protein [bacterium]